MRTRRISIALVLMCLPLFFLVCTINDDNGSATMTGPGSVYKPDTIASPVSTTVPFPAIYFIHDSYVKLRDTLPISLVVMSDTSAKAHVYQSAKVIVRTTHGTLSAETLTTDRYGRAAVNFVDTVEGKADLTIRCEQTQVGSKIVVTSSLADRIQKRIKAVPRRVILSADGKDTTLIDVKVLNENNNPLSGEYVQFVSTAGTIAGVNPPAQPNATGMSLTDNNGIASAKLTAAAINDTAFVTVYLVSDRSRSDESRVVFQGVHIKTSASQQNFKTGSSVQVSATLIDGSGSPIPFTRINFMLGKLGGSNLAILSSDTITGADGTAGAVVSGNATGTDTLQVVSSGAKGSLKLNVTDLLLSLTLDQTVLQARKTKSTKLHISFARDNGSSLDNKNVILVRSYRTIAGADTTDTMSSRTVNGMCDFSIAALSYDGTMGLAVTGYNSANDIATADTILTFITTRNITAYALPSIINADATSSALISIQVKNEDNNPIVGDAISFVSDAGLIGSIDTTDEHGIAVAKLYSDRRNTIATVKATLVKDPTRTITVQVEFTGVTLGAAVVPQSINSSGIDTSTVTISLADAGKNPIVGEPVNFSPRHAGTHISLADSVTNNRGEAHCKVSGTGNGLDTIDVEAAGASNLCIIAYSTNILSIDTTPAPGIPHSYIANGSDSTLVTLTYLQGDRTTPIAGAEISTNITIGRFTGAVDTLFAKRTTTGQDGKISFYVKNPQFANTATISATAKKGADITSGAMQVYFKADLVHHIVLTGTPEVISTNGSRAKISAVAFDAMGNRVKDATIAFNMLSGPGGGERIDPPSALTDESGVASTYLYSGITPSTYKNILVVAGDFTKIKSDTVKFTISGPAHYITIRTNILEGKNPKDGTFILPSAAVVTDINGNPVADGSEVSFSLKVSGYRYYPWRAVWYSGESRYSSWDLDSAEAYLPFEDFNDNMRVDPGEDRNHDGIANRGEDRDGNGIFNPGPGFEDINHNGKRDFGFNYAAYLDSLSNGADYAYEPAEPFWRYTYWDTTAQRTAWDTHYADFNGNHKWDWSEPLLDPNMSDSVYMATPGYNPKTRQFPDIDVNQNGVPDPNTAVSIVRTIQTSGGKAINSIQYGQSDALRIEVMIWAECQGRVTQTPEQIILPIIIEK